MGRYDRAQTYFQEHPGILRDVGVSNQQTQQIMNYVNGQRSVYTIRNRVAAQTGEDLTVDQVARYLEILEEIGWIEMQEGN